jgi:hypothetical protein
MTVVVILLPLRMRLKMRLRLRLRAALTRDIMGAMAPTLSKTKSVLRGSGLRVRNGWIYMLALSLMATGDRSGVTERTHLPVLRLPTRLVPLPPRISFPICTITSIPWAAGSIGWSGLTRMSLSPCMSPNMRKNPRLRLDIGLLKP